MPVESAVLYNHLRPGRDGCRLMKSLLRNQLHQYTDSEIFYAQRDFHAAAFLLSNYYMRFFISSRNMKHDGGGRGDLGRRQRWLWYDCIENFIIKEGSSLPACNTQVRFKLNWLAMFRKTDNRLIWRFATSSLQQQQHGVKQQRQPSYVCIKINWNWNTTESAAHRNNNSHYWSSQVAAQAAQASYPG